MNVDSVIKLANLFYKTAEITLSITDEGRWDRPQFDPNITIRKYKLSSKIEEVKKYLINIWQQDYPYERIAKLLKIKPEEVKSKIKEPILQMLRSIIIYVGDSSDIEDLKIFPELKVLTRNNAGGSASGSYFVEIDVKGDGIYHFTVRLVHELKHCIFYIIDKNYSNYRKELAKLVSSPYVKDSDEGDDENVDTISYKVNVNEQSSRIEEMRNILALGKTNITPKELYDILSLSTSKDIIVFNPSNNIGYIKDFKFKPEDFQDLELKNNFQKITSEKFKPLENIKEIDDLLKDYYIQYYSWGPKKDDSAKSERKITYRDIGRFLYNYIIFDKDRYLVQDDSGEKSICVAGIDFNRMATSFNQVAAYQGQKPKSAVV